MQNNPSLKKIKFILILRGNLHELLSYGDVNVSAFLIFHFPKIIAHEGSIRIQNLGGILFLQQL